MAKRKPPVGTGPSFAVATGPAVDFQDGPAGTISGDKLKQLLHDPNPGTQQQQQQQGQTINQIVLGHDGGTTHPDTWMEPNFNWD